MRKRKTLPPHSWETKSLTGHAEIKKPYIIAIVTVVALIALILLLFMGKQFVGKAISLPEAGVPAGQGGIFLVGEEYVGNTFTVPIVVSLEEGQQSVAVNFSLRYGSPFPAAKLEKAEFLTETELTEESGTGEFGTPIEETPVEESMRTIREESEITNYFTVNCDQIFAALDEQFNFEVAEEDLHLVRTVDCGVTEEGVITFQYTGLCADGDCSNAISELDFTIAEIEFTALEPVTNDQFESAVYFTEFSVMDLESEELLIDEGTVDTNVEILAAAEVCDPACADGEICTAGVCVEEEVDVCDPTCADGEICSAGVCVEEEVDVCDPTCADGEVCSAGVCVEEEVDVCDPTCADGEVCTDGACVEEEVDVCDPTCADGEVCTDGACVEEPEALPLVCNGVYAKDDQFLLGTDTIEYMSADHKDKTVPIIKYKNLFTGETIERLLLFDTDGIGTFDIKHGGLTYNFESASDTSSDDWDIQYLCEACELLGETQPCGYTDVGACEFGTQTCTVDGWEVCQDSVTSTVETCDGLDNDCDGLIDCADDDCDAEAACLPTPCTEDTDCTTEGEICIEETCQEGARCIEDAECPTTTAEFCSDSLACTTETTYTCTETICAVDVIGDEVCDDTACEYGCSAGACILVTMDDCLLPTSDVDGDGYNNTGGVCGAVDCDDTDEYAWIDVTAYYDQDGDGYGNVTNSSVICANNTHLPTGYETQSEDCDLEAARNPGVTDTPGDGIDQDCNGGDATVITPAADTPPSGGGGGSRCSSNWQCGQWSLCNASLQQTRTCSDLKRCDYRNPTKIENQSCAKCAESWVCSLWSECRNDINTRSCLDEHQCGTVVQKPGLQKGCQQTVPPGPAPGRITSQLPTYTPPPAVQQPAATVKPSLFTGLWEEYKTFVIAIPSSLILLILIIFLIVHFAVHKKKVVHNVEELKEWVKKEKSMGTSDEDVRSILKEHTGWSEEEIKQAFK